MFANRIVFGLTVLCQVKPDINGTSEYYLNDSSQQTWMYTIIAIGSCIGPIPLYWGDKLSTKLLLIIYGTISALSSLLYPLADSSGFTMAMITRFFAGFAQASQSYFSNELVLTWAGVDERSFFFSFILGSAQFGSLIAMALGGELCSTLGWEVVYYLLGLLTLLSTIVSAYYYNDNVQNARLCSDNEKKRILQGKSVVNKSEKVPYKSLLLDKTIIVAIFLFVCYNIGMIVFQQYIPTYFNDQLGISIRGTGYFAAIPMAIAIALKIVLGRVLDLDLGFSKTVTFNSLVIIIELVAGIALFLTGMTNDQTLSLIYSMIYGSLHLFVPVITNRTIQAVAHQHAHFAMNISMILTGLSQILVPLCVQLILSYGQGNNWSLLFTLTAILTIGSTIIYIIFARVKLASWVQKVPEQTSNRYTKKSSVADFDMKI
ncbi:unnamed protein product [Auanema sp. JU1783]|nr:unnamed protein product [Auanema sp. JU1783]